MPVTGKPNELSMVRFAVSVLLELLGVLGASCALAVDSKESAARAEVDAKQLWAYPVTLTMGGAGITTANTTSYQLDTLMGQTETGAAIGVEGNAWRCQRTQVESEGGADAGNSGLPEVTAVGRNMGFCNERIGPSYIDKNG